MRKRARRNEMPQFEVGTSRHLEDHVADEAEIYFVVDGLDPIYLGDLNSQTAIDFCNEMDDIGINYVIDNAVVNKMGTRMALRANGNRSEETIERIRELSREAFESEKDIDLTTFIPDSIRLSDYTFNNPKRKMRSDECSLGRHLGQEISYPISVREVENISFEEAGINLAFCFPSFIYNESLKVPKATFDEFAEKKYVSQAFIDQQSDSDQKAIRRISQNVVDKYFKSNAKLQKQYVPSEMGIGEPSEITGYNITPTLGAEGLNLTNANSLFGGEEITGMPPIRDVLQGHLDKLRRRDYDDRWFTTDQKGNKKYFTRDADFAERLELSLETLLEALSGFTQSNDCCTNKSKGCYANCLSFSGQRNKTTNIFKEKTNLSEGINRMLSAYLHTSFLANPYYFLRLLIHATYQHVSKHLNELCEHNSNARNDNDLQVIDDIEAYVKKLPPSLRLNVYSDYIWEKIYADYFTLFDLDNPQRFGNYEPASVMFYDYTKHPTRWSTEQRKKLFREVGIKWDKKFEYHLPKNYHLTFSFSGTQPSFINSQICGLAGQNATYVFSSASITSNAVSWALENTQQVFGEFSGSEVWQAFERLNNQLKAKLEHYFSLNFQDVDIRNLKYSGSTQLRSKGKLQYLELLPATYFGIPVISGDLYDIRYLDKYKQVGDESVIVGLAWKTPNNVQINVNGQSKELEPSICAMFLKDEGNTDVGVGFGIPRYLLGQAVNFTVDDVPRVLTMYVVAKSPRRKDVQKAIEDLASLDIDQLSMGEEFKISSATETGAVMNVPIGSSTIQFMVVDAVNEAIDKLI